MVQITREDEGKNKGNKKQAVRWKCGGHFWRRDLS
jgi:hypothetical protein